MSRTKIKFGTSGWRAILAEDFTFANAARVVDSIILYLRSTGKDKLGVAVGSDARFLGKEFRERTAKQLAEAGINVYCTERDCPTPVLSFTVRHLGLGGVINYTASHNPASHNGLKVSGKDATPVGYDDGLSTVEKLVMEGDVKPVENKGKVIVALLPDTGDRYLSTPMFAD